MQFFIKREKKKRGISYPEELKEDVKSLEYEIFKEEEKYATLPRTIYEKLARISEKILPIEPDEKTKKEIEEAIDFAHINITPRGVMSLIVLATLILIPLSTLPLFLGYLDVGAGIFILIFVALAIYYLYTYPQRLKKIFELRASSEIVMLILHMVIYMKNFPNLEKAVKFASSKLSGPLGLDMKKLLWDVYVGKYSSMEKALISYSQKWTKVFRPLADSINSIIYSLYVGEDRRLQLLDEAVEIILTALNEKSESYVSKLKTPVVMVNALGILLPTLVLTMLPIVTIFLGSEISPVLTFAFYDFFLPIILVFIIKNILDQRVVTLPEPDISLHPNLPPEDTFRFLNYYVPCYLPAIAVFLPFLYFLYLKAFTMNLYESFVVTAGLFLPFIVFFFLSSFQKIKLRREIVEMEDEFREILFALGQEMDRGIPIESALEKIKPVIKGYYAMNLIQKITENIKYKGMTLHKAIFEEKEGAILNFPSRLIYSVLKTLVEASAKGTKIVSDIMLSISKHLDNLHRTQKNIEDKFSEVISTMNMQAKILLPLLTGIMVTLCYVMLEMLKFMEEITGSLAVEGAATQYMFFLSLWKNVNMSASAFQIAIGIYTLETIIILSWFISGVSVGVDKISFYDTACKNLIAGCLLYFIVCFASLMIFQPFVEVIKYGMIAT